MAQLNVLKARLVAKDLIQKEGINYHETFSQVVKLIIVRSLVVLVVKEHWDIHQFDVNNDFLHRICMRRFT